MTTTTNGESSEARRRIAALPKVELHAHLSGSIRQAFLAERSASFRPVDVVTPRSLEACFEYFGAVRHVITDIAGLEAAARDVVASFAADGCVYLELRTTPKRLGDADEAAYVDAVRNAARTVEADMDVRLLLSIDRGVYSSSDLESSVDAATRRVGELRALAERFPGFVVGYDVCGDPRAKTLQTVVLPALRNNAPLGLPLTVHTAEIADDAEARAVVDAMTGPHGNKNSSVEEPKCCSLDIRRLGHCCYLPTDCRDRLSAAKVAVELCPTSNLVAMRLDGYADHHFPNFFHNGVTVTVNTDDAGLFDCTLSSELEHLAGAFDLTFDDLVRLQRDAIEASFHPDKAELRKRWDRRFAERFPSTNEAAAAEVRSPPPPLPEVMSH